jgi:hypothetical protein
MENIDDLIKPLNLWSHLRFLPDLTGKTVIEFGPLEGSHTIALAQAAERVLVYELRPSNLCRTFLNCIKHNLRNVDYYLADVNEVTLPKVDLLYHSGVLYHLGDPISHLKKIYGVADLYLFDTHVYNMDDDLHGYEQYGSWFKFEDLLSTLNSIGYRNICVHRDYYLNSDYRRVTLTCHGEERR